jgi:hypothetical protein
MDKKKITLKIYKKWPQTNKFDFLIPLFFLKSGRNRKKFFFFLFLNKNLFFFFFQIRIIKKIFSIILSNHFYRIKVLKKKNSFQKSKNLFLFKILFYNNNLFLGIYNIKFKQLINFFLLLTRKILKKNISTIFSKKIKKKNSFFFDIWFEFNSQKDFKKFYKNLIINFDCRFYLQIFFVFCLFKILFKNKFFYFKNKILMNLISKPKILYNYLTKEKFIFNIFLNKCSKKKSKLPFLKYIFSHQILYFFKKKIPNKFLLFKKQSISKEKLIFFFKTIQKKIKFSFRILRKEINRYNFKNYDKNFSIFGSEFFFLKDNRFLFWLKFQLYQFLFDSKITAYHQIKRKLIISIFHLKIRLISFDYIFQVFRKKPKNNKKNEILFLNKFFVKSKKMLLLKCLYYQILFEKKNFLIKIKKKQIFKFFFTNIQEFFFLKYKIKEKFFFEMTTSIFLKKIDFNRLDSGTKNFIQIKSI